MLQLSYPKLLNLINPYTVPGRSESASFLAWYLRNYYRMDETETIDSICDDSGDKGVDGIYLNDNEGTVDIFQARISQKESSSIGDKALREFQGTLSQFKDAVSIGNLLTSAGDADVAKLIKRLNIINVMNSYTVRGIYLSNIDADANGFAYLKSASNIAFIGRKYLLENYISSRRGAYIDSSFSFDCLGYDVTSYTVDEKIKALVAPIKAEELVKLKGIADQSIFDANLRGHLGSTTVNRDIVDSIQDKTKHKLFPLFHNGITVVCEHLKADNNKLSIKNYAVINGCQSLKSLFDNRSHISSDLRILTRFVRVPSNSSILKMITSFSNNQNGIKARDFKSNHEIQVRLQNEFRKHYGKEFFYEVKRGESPNGLTSISNEDAGLLLLAFDVKEPWSTHQKYKIFDDKYSAIFARPEVNADRIVMLNVCLSIINSNLGNVKNQLIAKYTLTRYMLLYILREILESDCTGRCLIADSRQFVRDSAKRTKFGACINKIVKDVVIDLNADLKDLPNDFDYRTKLKSPEWVKETSKNIVTNYTKLVSRERIDSFEKEWGSS